MAGRKRTGEFNAIFDGYKNIQKSRRIINDVRKAIVRAIRRDKNSRQLKRQLMTIRG